MTFDEWFEREGSLMSAQDCSAEIVARAAWFVASADSEKSLTVERERADFAWKNTRIIEAARQEEMRKRDAAEAECGRLRGLILLG